MALISYRYAKALYLIAKNSGKEKQVLDCFKCVLDSKCLEDNNFYQEFPDFFINFLLLLRRKHKLYLLTEIYREFYKIYNLNNNKISVDIFSPFYLGESKLEVIKNVLSKKLKYGIILQNKIDKNLIGGFVVKFDDKILDFSLLGKLKQLESKIRK